MIPITYIIIIITVLVSLAALYNEKIMNQLIFYPPAVTYEKQYYRFISCGFIHADYFHLLFNMFAFYGFGLYVERGFEMIFPTGGKLLYVAMYLIALIVCLLPTYSQHKTDGHYRSLGASGAVAAVIFASIMIDPTITIGILFIPFGIPGFIFGPLYLLLSYYLDKRGGGNVNHSAHIWGALFGVAFMIVAGKLFADYNAVSALIAGIQSYLGR